MNKLLILSLLLSLTSCFKTAEQIKREKQIDTQLNQSSKIIADLTTQLKNVQNGLSTTSGKIEEIDYKRQKSSEEQELTFSQTLAQLSEQVKILTQENRENKELIKNLTSKVDSQNKFIKKVTGTLTKMSGSNSSSGTSQLKVAHKAFEKNQKTKAKKLYNAVLSSGKINAAQRNHVYFNLGLLEFWNKKYNESLVYFSKIYTKYPRSSFAPRSLLYIARAFSKSGKTDEAKASYQELIKNYPKSKHAATAQKEI